MNSEGPYQARAKWGCELLSGSQVPGQREQLKRLYPNKPAPASKRGGEGARRGGWSWKAWGAGEHSSPLTACPADPQVPCPRSSLCCPRLVAGSDRNESCFLPLLPRGRGSLASGDAPGTENWQVPRHDSSCSWARGLCPGPGCALGWMPRQFLSSRDLTDRDRLSGQRREGAGELACHPVASVHPGDLLSDRSWGVLHVGAWPRKGGLDPASPRVT